MPGIQGVVQAQQQMRRLGAAYAAKYAKGAKKAGLFLQAKSMELVPVETGNLKNTAFTRALGEGFDTVVLVGYTAPYALYVHENLEALHGSLFNATYADKIANAHTAAEKRIWFARGPNQQAKFLETPARDRSVKRQMQKIIYQEMNA